MDALNLLARRDKWALAGTTGALFAPTQPLWLLTPGFWDESHFVDIRLEHLFTLFFLTEKGKPLSFHSELIEWRPDRIILHHHHPTGTLKETRCVTPLQAWVSVFERESAEPWDVIVWSLQKPTREASGVIHAPGENPSPRAQAWSWEHKIYWAQPPEEWRLGTEAVSEFPIPSLPPSEPKGAFYIALGANLKRITFATCPSDPGNTNPSWENCPARELMGPRGLKSLFTKKPPGNRHLLLHYRWTTSQPLKVVACAGTSRESALTSLQKEIQRDSLRASTRAWERRFQSVPQFSCSDELITRYYWYRWYVLFLNAVEVPLGNLTYPCTFEGVGPFRNLIAYSAPAHIREAVWIHGGTLARGIVQNFLTAQREDGSFPGHLYSFRPPRDFYHTNWGDALDALFTLWHPDDLPEILSQFEKYATFLDTARDAQHSGMIDVGSQHETGQEYSPRYLFANPKADQDQPFQLKGVDATYYALRLRTVLTHWFRTIGDEASAMRNLKRLSQLRKGLLKHMWDEKKGFFKDALWQKSPTNQTTRIQLSPVLSAVGFYPLARAPVSRKQISQLTKNLLNPKTFWTPLPIPSLSRNDPLFSPEGFWKGIRKNCPWNGRTWPMINSHLIEGLMVCAERNRKLASLAGEIFKKWTYAMFLNGDPSKPTSYEHYNPLTNEPSLFRGVDDYFHSWYCDLVIRYLCGINPARPREGNTRMNLDLKWWAISNVPTPSGTIEREWKQT